MRHRLHRIAPLASGLTVPTLSFQPFFTRRIRLHPAYTLSALEDLSTEHRAALRGLTEHPDYAALLLPTPGSQRPVKAVGREVADLLRMLRAPATLQPRWTSTEDALSTVAALILDGTLEIETDGGYRSGPAVVTSLVSGRPTAPDTTDRLAHLSWAALQYGQLLPLPPRALAARLYAYHRLPLPFPRRAAASEDPTRSLGLAPDQPLCAMIETAFTRIPHDHWHVWLRHGRDVEQETPLYKLYLSPHPDDLPQVLDRCMPILVEDTTLRSFKVGRDRVGLLRPDKCILYFADAEALTRMADRLRPLLRGVRAHGVPFTSGLTDDGLLSWGLDPPGSEQVLESDTRQSWRSWITRRLAQALIRAQACDDVPVAPWQYALIRVALDGVDTNTWTPRPALWLTQDITPHAEATLAS